MVGLRDDLRLALDRVAFARACGIEPDVLQEKVLRSDSRRMLLNCSRQAGKSTLGGIRALHLALYRPDSLVLCLAPALRQSQELFTKVLTCYRISGRLVGARSEGRLSLELENGSRIITLPGTEKNIRGFSGASLLVVDEASRVDDELYFAVRPMLAVSGGSLMMLSTPYGKRGAFYEEWIGDGDWERFSVTGYECPHIPPAFLEDERRRLPDHIFRREYLCEFQETAAQVFSDEVIALMFADETTTPLWEGR